MSDSARLYRVTRWRASGADCGHAMPFAQGIKAHVRGIIVLDTPAFARIQGRAMPISRGSPPTPA